MFIFLKNHFWNKTCHCIHFHSQSEERKRDQLFILHEVLLEDIQILSDNIYKNLNRIDITIDLTYEMWPNKEGSSRLPSQALPAL